MPVREVYERDRNRWAATEAARRRAKWPRVPDEELERLRRPENRQEALAYGPEQKQLVCLNCGRIYLGNFSRHPTACPSKPQSSDAYKEQWGYAKSNPLASVEWRRRASTSKQGSEKFRVAQERNRPVTLAAFSARRAAVTEAKKERPLRRGPMRREAILRRSAGQRGKPRKLRKPEITDSQIERILALDLPLDESARRAGLSVRAFRSRAKIRHGWNADNVKARRSLVNKYIFDLRRWVFSERRIPSVEDVTNRHMIGLRSRASEIFRQFRPFVPHLEAELNADPKWLTKLSNRHLNGTPIALASKVFQRARKRTRGGAPKKLNPEHMIFGKSVEAMLDRFRKAFDLLAKAKRENPSSSQHWTVQLRAAGFTDGEISTILASRKPQTAAIRRMCEREGKTFKSGKNDYGLFLRHKPTQSTE
jgi:hypothetical protein